MLWHSSPLKWKFLLPPWQIRLVNHHGLLWAPEMESCTKTWCCCCWYCPQPWGIQIGFLLSAEVAHLALLDAPWLVTAISALNEGVNRHLLLLPAQHSGNGSLDSSGRAWTDLIRDLLYNTKTHSWNHAVALWISDVAQVIKTSLWTQKVLKSTYLLCCKGHALQTWESMLGSMHFALKQ